MDQNEDTYRYPWLRNLFLLVLYVALLIFLWHFPLEGARLFFRVLMRGFLYLIAGLILAGGSVLLFLLFAPPLSEYENMEDEDIDAFLDEGMVLLPGHSLGIPQLRNPAQAQVVWEVLSEFENSTSEESVLIVDEQAGIVILSAEIAWEADELLHQLSRHLVDAGFKVKRVNT